MYVRSKRNNRKQDFEKQTRKKMRTLTLSDSVFRAQLQHSCPKFQKSINSHPSLLSLIPLSQKQKFNHFTRNLISSRFSRKLSQNSTVDDTWLDQNRRSSSDTHSIIQHGFDTMDKANVDISSRSGNCSSTVFELDDSTVSDTSFHSLLKFSVLFGLLTLQGTQQALAGSEFATGLQLPPYLGDLGDISTGFASAFLLIFFSELGDKTFFIAALLAARNSGAIVFLGTFGALALMTIISVVLGRTFHYVDDILPFRFGETDLPIDDIAAVGLLVYFGVSTLIEAASSDGLKTEGEQKEAELAVSEFSGDGAGILAAANTVISTFALVFVAEWGDKSFFSTIALSAASSPLGVIGGALAGHAAATLLAVLGGSLLGTFLSEKVIAYVGGTLFLVFAAVTVIEIVS